ncbi:MAG: hypothetical protein HFG26_00740 [Provencibacterium sp.]|jgi:ribosomal protein L14E/L6E/L27E|nr:hypothetical protein [Provencibacterium sp.]
MPQLQVGSIVRSRAGRDKDGFFTVMRLEGDFAWLCDGKSRPLSRPKKKRLRHLELTHGFILKDAIRSDKQLRGLLKGYSEQSG